MHGRATRSSHRGDQDCMNHCRVPDSLDQFTTGPNSEESIDGVTDTVAKDSSIDDIEKDITSEIADIRKPSKKTGIAAVWTDVPCLVFFRTSPPIDPVSLVQDVVRSAAKDPTKKRTRCTQRLTPSTLIGFASEEGLDKVAREVLAPHFHAELAVPKKFAIRPNIRNHNILKRDGVIKQVASIVGPGHTVDLKNYDLLILVDIMKNVCGLSVVGPEYESLKRYNLQEIFEPTSQQPQPDAQAQ
ncbi:hypothetical protein K461DRAFT_276416 [Myriangium duriaei CBS 260.36]|uniref:THUMP domain-containing protein n=1 Tax=Myriangium duriaei CBS 260.36 TaxID=1168546 RepID=A0A9P4J8S8_9PEZI|nr:hypothetical protein K461DRAFT_276416 [Myriangium duriaei CBS 260.36]